MTIFSVDKSHFSYIPVHATKLASVKDNINTFYDELTAHRSNSEEDFSEFLDLEIIIPSVISFLISQMVGPHSEILRHFDGVSTKHLYSVSPTHKGQSSCAVYSGPLQSLMKFHTSSMFGTAEGREMIQRLLFFPAKTGGDSFGQSNAHLFLWWDTFNCRGKFLCPMTYQTEALIDFSKPINCSIIMCTKQILSEPSTIQAILEKTSCSYSGFNLNTPEISVLNTPVIGTYISVPRAQTFARCILSQKASFFRPKFFAAINDLIYDNRVWQMAFQCTATGRFNTITQYMSHIRGFSKFTGFSVKQIFRNMRNFNISAVHLERFFRYRLSRVNIDTCIQGVNAFLWFNRRFHRTHEHFHEKVFSTIRELKKRLQSEKNGSEPLSWSQMQVLLKQIKRFDWRPFSASQIYDMAVISLWGALRISESVHLSHASAGFFQDADLLRVTVWDGKSATGDKLQWKYISGFPSFPEFCPHRAFHRLSQGVSRYDGFIHNSRGKPISTSMLSSRFAKFITFLKDLNILPQDKKITWHVFRSSYMNISFDEFGLPLNYSQATACHRALASSEHYVAKREEKRRIIAAQAFARHASDKMADTTDPGALVFVSLLQNTS